MVSYKGTGVIKSDGAEKKADISGSLVLKGENKVNFLVRVTQGSETTTFCLVSNGSTMMMVDGPEERPVKQTPKHLTSAFTSSVSRSGVLPFWMLFSYSISSDQRQEEFGPDLKKILTLSNVAFGSEDESGKWLSYRLSRADGDLSLDVKLYYNPASFKLLKRSVTVKAKDSTASFEEQYSDFSLGSEIPDEKFVLPGKK
jgi:hypothetical protein